MGACSSTPKDREHSAGAHGSSSNLMALGKEEPTMSRSSVNLGVPGQMDDVDLILETFYVQSLSCATYIVGSVDEKRAFIIDPLCDVADYIEFLNDYGLDLNAILLTHLPTDFVSGYASLHQRYPDCKVYCNDPTSCDYVTPLNNTDFEFEISLTHKLVPILTPGHTPGSACYLLEARPDIRMSYQPVKIFTGDTLLPGTVGSPDQCFYQNESEEEFLLGQLYASVRDKLLVLPDTVELLAGHGFGSRHLPENDIGCSWLSTIGDERKMNPCCRLRRKQMFFNWIRISKPAPSPMGNRILTINQSGADSMETIYAKLPLMDVMQFRSIIDRSYNENEKGRKSYKLSSVIAEKHMSGHRIQASPAKSGAAVPNRTFFRPGMVAHDDDATNGVPLTPLSTVDTAAGNAAGAVSAPQSVADDNASTTSVGTASSYSGTHPTTHQNTLVEEIGRLQSQQKDPSHATSMGMGVGMGMPLFTEIDPQHKKHTRHLSHIEVPKTISTDDAMLRTNTRENDGRMPLRSAANAHSVTSGIDYYAIIRESDEMTPARIFGDGGDDVSHGLGYVPPYVILDMREANEFCESHIPGSINCPTGSSRGVLLSSDEGPVEIVLSFIFSERTKIILVCNSREIRNCVARLSRIGLNKSLAAVLKTGYRHWARQFPKYTVSTQRIEINSKSEFSNLLSHYKLVDIRQEYEQNRQLRPEVATILPFTELGLWSTQAETWNRSRRYVLFSSRGWTSILLASILQTQGIAVVDVSSGFAHSILPFAKAYLIPKAAPMPR